MRPVLANVALFSILLMPSVQAQTAPQTFDAAETLDLCLSGEGAQQDGADSCIGLISNKCLEGTMETTMDNLRCDAEEIAVWDRRLNVAYKSLQQIYKQNDAEMSEYDGFNRANELREVQRAWIVWRDAKCDFAYGEFRGGTMGKLSASYCQTALTAERALELEDLLSNAQL